MDPSALDVANLHHQSSADHIWILMATALVLFMQVGFLFLEAGVTRSKNAISVAQKNLGDFCLSVATFYAIGFSVMFGTSWGWFGWSADLAFFDTPSDWALAFFGFQAVFAGTTATIMSGAVAERMRFVAYMVCVVLLAAVLYPVFGHWAWGNLLDGDNPAWLADAGFLDFAGSTVVHSAGGWFALGVIIVLGARQGRFAADGRPNDFHGHSLVLSAAGCVILLFGWFGFNAGSTVAATSDVALILANTLVAAVFGGLAGKLTGRALSQKMSPLHVINGVLGGLVGITAGCAFVGVAGAAQIGMICGVAVILSEYLLLHKLKLDDVVGAVSVHGTCGAVGTVLLALYAKPEMLALDGRSAQFLVQLQGVVLAFALFTGSGWLIAKGLARFGLLRVSETDERHGLNLAEHGVQMGTGVLQEALARITLVERDLTQRLDTSGGDDASEMAAIINPFLEEMQQTLRNLSKHSDEVVQQASALERVSAETKTSRETLSGSSQSLVSAATELEEGANATQKTIGAVKQKAEGLAAASTALRQDMAAMSETAKDMSMAIHMVVRDTQETTASSVHAKTTAQEGFDRIVHLQSVTQSVEDVVKHISDIADKTILLALNARVEAARSGEAGRGFAVVAQEVAELSKQTQSAADQINGNLSEMLAGGQDALTSMTSVKEVLENLETRMGTILQSTQTQAAALSQFEALANNGREVAQEVERGSEIMLAETAQIAKFAGQVKDGSQSTRSLAESVARSAEESGAASETLLGASERLSSGSGSLKTAAARFKA